MQRYFISNEQMQKDICVLEGQDVHHILRVLRLQPGAKIICCNSVGRTVLARIEQMNTERVICQIIDEMKESRELPVRVTIAQSLPKGDKLEWILQKGTELGVAQFVPFFSARTIVKYDAKKEERKRERWQKIVKEAAEQAQRDFLPTVESVHTWSELLGLEADCKLVAYEGVSMTQKIFPSPFVQALQTMTAAQKKHLLVVIGPEGGLDEGEVHQLKEVGFQTISLGKRILRTETAALYVLAGLSFYYEQLGGVGLWPE